ncbi:MAG: pentapeptide repeat-containing protein [Verrucomicrobiales bacterium]
MARAERDRALAGLRALLEDAGSPARVRLAAFAFIVRATKQKLPLPDSVAVQAGGLDLTAWEMCGTPGRPLRLAGADFSGATLIRARFHHVEMPGSRWAGADLCSAEFLGCGLEKAEFAAGGTRLEGARLRACRLTGSRVAGADLAGSRVVLPVWDAATEQHWRDCLASHPAGFTAPAPPTHPFPEPPEACWSLGHSNSVMSVAFSADGSRILSGSDDNTVRVWDALSGAALKVTKDDERALRERGGRAGREVSISPLSTLRWTSGDGTQFDATLLPDGGFLVLKQTAEPLWRIAAARGEYWSYVNHATDDERGRILWSADVCGSVW